MALPGWGALAYVANSAYSYATGTYLPSDAKRLRCVQSAYQQAYGTQDVPSFFQLENGLPCERRAQELDDQLYTQRRPGCEFGAAADCIIRAIISYQRRREQRAPSTTCYSNDPHNLVCDELKHWVRHCLLEFQGQEHECLEVRRRLDFVYNVATDDAVFKAGGAMRALLGEVIRELNKVLQALQGDFHQAAQALFRQFAIHCADAVRHSTLFLFNVLRTGPLADDRGFVGLATAVFRIQQFRVAPPSTREAEDPFLDALNTTSGCLVQALLTCPSFECVTEGCAPAHGPRAPRPARADVSFYDATGAPCIPPAVAAVRPPSSQLGFSRLGQRLGDHAGVASHFLKDAAGEALGAWLALHGALQRLASLVALGYAARDMAGQGGNILVLLLGGEYVRQFLNVFTQLANEVTSKSNAILRAADAYIPDGLRLAAEHPDFPWLTYHRRAKSYFDVLLRDLQQCRDTSTRILARADEIPHSADLLQQQVTAFVDTLQQVAGSCPMVTGSPFLLPLDSPASSSSTSTTQALEAGGDRVLTLTKLQFQSQQVPFGRKPPPLGASASLQSAPSPAESEASSSQLVLASEEQGAKDPDLDWLDVTIPGAEKDRWAQELERASKELYLQYHNGVWDCELTEADKLPFQHEVLKQTAVHLNTMSDIVGNHAGEVYREELRHYATSLASASVRYGLKGAAQAVSFGKLSASTLTSIGTQLYEHWTVGRHFQQQ